MVKANGLSEKVKIFAGLAEDFDCGENKVDIIVSEWMGYCLLYENMLPSVLSIRDRCLKEEGLIIPRRAKIILAGFESDARVQGVDYSALQ